MKMKLIKSALSTSLMVAFSISFITPTLAAGINNDVDMHSDSDLCINYYFDFGRYEAMSEAELKVEMMSLGISKAQAEELLALQKDYRYDYNAKSLPDDAEIGDVHTEEFYFAAENMQTTAEIFANLVNSGVPAVAAGVVAAAILASLTDDPGAAGVKVTVEYYYGYDNDGEVRWNYRRVWFDLY